MYNFKDDLYEIVKVLDYIKTDYAERKMDELSLCIQSLYFYKTHVLYSVKKPNSTKTAYAETIYNLMKDKFVKKDVEEFLNMFSKNKYTMDDIILYIKDHAVTLEKYPVRNQHVFGKKFKYWNITSDYESLYYTIACRYNIPTLGVRDVIPSDVLENYVLDRINTSNLKYPDISDYLRNRDIPESKIPIMIYGLSLKFGTPLDSMELIQMTTSELVNGVASTVLYRVPIAGYAIGNVAANLVKNNTLTENFKKVSDESRILDESGEVTTFLNNNTDGTPAQKLKLVEDSLAEYEDCYKQFFQKNSMTFLILWLNTNFNPFMTNDYIEDGYYTIDYKSELEVILNQKGITDLEETVDKILCLLPQSIKDKDKNRYRVAYSYADVYLRS